MGVGWLHERVSADMNFHFLSPVALYVLNLFSCVCLTAQLAVFPFSLLTHPDQTHLGIMLSERSVSADLLSGAAVVHVVIDSYMCSCTSDCVVEDIW